MFGWLNRWVTDCSWWDCGICMHREPLTLPWVKLLLFPGLEAVLGSNHKGKPGFFTSSVTFSHHLRCARYLVWIDVLVSELDASQCTVELAQWITTLSVTKDFQKLSKSRSTSKRWKTFLNFVHLLAHWKPNWPKWNHCKLQNPDKCLGLLISQDASSWILLFVLQPNPV